MTKGPGARKALKMTDELSGHVAAGDKEGNVEESAPSMVREVVVMDEESLAATVGRAGTKAQASGGVKSEPLGDWLEPLEEEDAIVGDGEMESNKGGETRTMRRLGTRGRKRRLDVSADWIACPGLGAGWRRREVFRRSGTSVGKTDTYYISPNGDRVRSKIELAKLIPMDLAQFDYKTGMFLNGSPNSKKSKHRKEQGSHDDGIHSEHSLSSERTLTPDPNRAGTPGTPQSTGSSRVPTPQRPQLTPAVPAPPPPQPSATFSSPPRLTPVSPLRQDAQPPAQLPPRSPSLRLGDFSPQRLSPSDTSIADGSSTKQLPHPWLHASLEPVSPPRTPEEELHGLPGLVYLKRSPSFPLPPTPRLTLDPNVLLNGDGQHRQLSPILHACDTCSSYYPGARKSEDGLCPKCRSEREKLSAPNIVFRKVDGDKWVLGRTIIKEDDNLTDTRKGKKAVETKQPVTKSLRLMRLELESTRPQRKMHPDESDEEYRPEEDDDDDEEDGEDGEPSRKKRTRRVCANCEPCLRRKDCGRCDYCLDKPKFGGLNKKKQKCRLRQCLGQAAVFLSSDPVQAPEPEPEPEPEESDYEEYQTYENEDDDEDDGEAGRKKRSRRACQTCDACLRRVDCSKCDFCLDKPKFGGQNKKRQKCRLRQCQSHAMRHLLPHQIGRNRDMSEPGWVGSSKRYALPPQQPRKRGRPPGRQNLKRRVWNDDLTDDEDDEEAHYLSLGRGPRNSFEREEEEDTIPHENNGPQRHLLPHQIGRNRDMSEPGWVGSSKRYALPPQQPRKRGRPPGRQNLKRRVWNDDLTDDDDDEEAHYLSRGRGPRNSFEREEEEDTIPHENNGPQDHVMVISDHTSHFNTEEFYSSPYGFHYQAGHGGVEIGRDGREQPCQPMPIQQLQPQKIFLTLADLLPQGAQLVPSVLGGTSIPELDQDVQVVRVESPSPEPTPEITEVHSLAVGQSAGPGAASDAGLLRLLASLRRRVLPAHWVGVMASGPLLQLLQCSKLSTMADTVLQIAPGLSFQISVQNQPLLPTHPLYEGHPAQLDSAGAVAALLLELEGLSVCQGYPGYQPQRRGEPMLYVRAAACQLLVPQDVKHCDRCQLPSEV